MVGWRVSPTCSSGSFIGRLLVTFVVWGPGCNTYGTLSDVGGEVLIGSNIMCTTGVYQVELQAIARTLAMQ